MKAILLVYNTKKNCFSFRYFVISLNKKRFVCYFCKTYDEF